MNIEETKIFLNTATKIWVKHPFRDISSAQRVAVLDEWQKLLAELPLKEGMEALKKLAKEHKTFPAIADILEKVPKGARTAVKRPDPPVENHFGKGWKMPEKDGVRTEEGLLRQRNSERRLAKMYRDLLDKTPPRTDSGENEQSDRWHAVLEQEIERLKKRDALDEQTAG